MDVDKKNQINTLLMSYNKVSKQIMTSKEAKTLISKKINKAFLFEKYFKNDTVSSQQVSDQAALNMNLDNLSLNSINNLTKQTSRKECLSEPEGRISSELKQTKTVTHEIEEKPGTTRENYQKTNKGDRSRRMFKFKSQNKVNHKIYDSEKIVEDTGATVSVVSGKG